MNHNASKIRYGKTRNNGNRLEKKKLIQKLAKYSHCKFPDEIAILNKTIQRLELYEHVIAVLEDQIQTLIIDSLNQEKSV